MMSLATNATGPGTASTRTSRREQLIATLEALIYNDDVDLELFQPGVPWPQARNTITQQPHSPLRAHSPEERSNIQSDYTHAPAVDHAMTDAAEYSQIYSDPFQNFHANSHGGTDKVTSWFPHVPEIGFESSVTTPSYLAPPRPTPPPPHPHEQRNNSHGLENCHYGQLNTQDHSGYIHYDYSKPLATPPDGSQPAQAQVAYPSISKSSILPLCDFMSWDMFMDYGSGLSPGPNDMDNNDSSNSADDLDNDRKASNSPRLEQNVQTPKSPSKTASHAPRRIRKIDHRRGSKSASPSSPTCSRPVQPTEKACQPRGHRAHSAIEKKYRAGINEKFEALRNCIESRKMLKQESLGQAVRPDSKGGESGGATTTAGPDRKRGAGGNGEPASRMNKAEVLSEAAEYIQLLEDENGLLQEQLKILVQRLRATRLALQPMTPMSTTSSAP